MLHLRPIPKPPKADTRALLNARTETHRKLRDEVVRATAREPRHFKEHEHFRKLGEKA